MNLLKDFNGILFSTDLILGFILLILILGTIVNLMDDSKDRTMNSLETSTLKKLTIEVVDNLINNPGTPKHWEKLSEFDIVNPGLAVENHVNNTIINTISFKKIKILENNEYDNLIGKKLFNNEIKSSISIYPIDCNIDPIFIGDIINSKNNISSSVSNIISVDRVVKCDFYREYSLINIFINDSSYFPFFNSFYTNENMNENINENINKNINKDTNKKTICNHETIEELNHSNDENYYWVCNEFKITKKDLDEKNFYLIFSEGSVNNRNYWILDNIEEIFKEENAVNGEKIDLNEYFSKIFENNTSMTFYLHSKINKEYSNQYGCVLVNLPKNIQIDDLNIDYFKEQDCKFIMQTYYA